MTLYIVAVANAANAEGRQPELGTIVRGRMVGTLDCIALDDRTPYKGVPPLFGKGPVSVSGPSPVSHEDGI